jgi:hypothetical protein
MPDGLSPATRDSALLARLGREGPMNLARAVEVMERHQLDGLVLGQPVNVFHATGHWPQIGRTRPGHPPSTFALLARARIDQPGLVTSRFLHYYSWADGRDRADVQVWLYGELGDEGDLSPGAQFDFCPDRGFAPLSMVESARHMATASVDPRHGNYRDAGAALVSAMRDMGLWTGRIGYDDPVIAGVCARHDRPGDLAWAQNILAEIRLIKSPLEQALLARAA